MIEPEQWLTEGTTSGADEINPAWLDWVKARLSAAEQERDKLREMMGVVVTEDEKVWHNAVAALRAERVACAAAEARAEAAEKLLTWLDMQLVGCLDYADALAVATGLPNARALRGDLVDARVAVRAALAGREETP